MKKLITSHALLTPETSSVCTHNDDCEMLSSRLFHYLSEDSSKMPEVISRNDPEPLLSDAIVNRLTGITWNPDSRTISLENCSYSERSELGGMEYVAGYVAKKFQNTHPSITKSDSEDLTGFWVDFINNRMNNTRGLTEPS